MVRCKCMFLILLLFLTACTGEKWKPSVYHPGSGNTGSRLKKAGDNEIGIQTLIYFPAMFRYSHAFGERLNGSLGYGIFNVDIRGWFASVNWRIIDTPFFYLSLSPNGVLYYNRDEQYSGISSALGITPGLKPVSWLHMYFPVQFIYYKGGKYSGGDAGSGRYVTYGYGLSVNFKKFSVTFEASAPTIENLGDTDLMLYAGFGFFIKL